MSRFEIDIFLFFSIDDDLFETNINMSVEFFIFFNYLGKAFT